MDPTPCHLCGMTTPRTIKTPTLLGIRPLCARCRPLYHGAVVSALDEYQAGQRHRTFLTPLPPRHAA